MCTRTGRLAWAPRSSIAVRLVFCVLTCCVLYMSDRPLRPSLDVCHLDVDVSRAPCGRPHRSFALHRGDSPSCSALAFQATWESLLSRTVSTASLGALAVSAPFTESYLMFGHAIPYIYADTPRAGLRARIARGDLPDILASLSAPNAIRSEVHGPPSWPSDIEM